ncbi:acetyl-CoA synthetase-like protein [Stereum hirsutum FP-91666 SS1]|uniref:acetyl-CoA synthetase-like protein n=1 Tax=Stereum hirsutum (strain FP-91666) TaxID=721885 RepID=UPI00044100EE|nr:acetyl-CoA synthetase-like protein [Stereum hirsutum FP-91666 SS1]EIM90194.1 acetyl-CoA synthetase-like protein [Stereum hirsutum FP-91666 SS1]
MSSSVDKTVLLPETIDYKRQAVEVPGTKKPGQTGHYRNGLYGLVDSKTPNVLTTLTEIFEVGLARSRDLTCLGHRPVISTNPLKYADHFVWNTYADSDIRRRQIGSALHHLFKNGVLGGGEYDTVGIWSQNRPEWQFVEWALNAYQKVGVSLYDTLGKDAVDNRIPYSINHAHLTIIFATANHIPDLLKLASRTPQVKMIVAIDELLPEQKQVLVSWGETQNVQIKELHELEEDGKANLVEPIPATKDQLASICYTSGTTSNPKGVLLTHSQLAMGVQANLYGWTITERGCLLSYLPLAHIYERNNELCVVATGGCIGYFTGDPLRLLEDAQILRPNYFPSVPRILNRVYQSAMAAGDVPGLKGALFRKAVATKLERLHTTGDPTHALWDKLVFRKIQAVLGGRIKLLTSGSAPISPEVMDFLKIAFACDVLEGQYGMTENAAVCTHMIHNDPSSSGTTGPPAVTVEVKLLDVPAMGYTSEDKPFARGELCCRGENSFREYYKDDKNTKETVDEEGWVHTGDVAMIDDCGRVKIIDRVKNIMKLAQGEYVALEKIENIYSTHPLVQQFFVHGDGLKSYLLAVVVLDPITFAQLAGKISGTRLSEKDVEAMRALCADERVVKAVLADLLREGKKNGLKGFEIPKRIHLSMDPFTIEENTLTPTLKLRRKDAFNKYAKELTALYALPDPDEGGPRSKL